MSVSQRVSERGPESERVSQSEPESELGSLKVSLRAPLGPNLRCQSQPRQSELENISFCRFFFNFCCKQQFYDVFLRVNVTKYRKYIHI